MTTTTRQSGSHDEANDIVTAVLEDHEEITTMLNDVDASAPGDARRERFEALVAKLAVHETAEEEVVHPLVRRTGDGADDVVDERLEEESNGKAALAELEKMGADDARFTEKFSELRADVLAHAEHEQEYELPRLQCADSDQLARAASVFRTAQRMAPTHAHAHSPESATGNLLVGPFIAVADRARDAIRETMDAPAR
jgi:hemerythrin superfamily protein